YLDPPSLPTRRSSDLQYSHSLLSKLQRANKIERVYRAIVYGKMPERSGTIDAPIGRNPDSIIERMVREDGKRAVTHYETLMETEDRKSTRLNSSHVSI